MASTDTGSGSSEGRALSAALSAPTPFRTRAGAGLLHTAERHVQRFAPETDGPQRSRGLGALAFVDRLVVPWVMAAQQSTSMRLFGEYIARGPGQRAGGQVSWVFPRPWYQDELDWMAAAREGGTGMPQVAQPQGLFTTRGTFESPAGGGRRVDESRQSPASLAAPAGLEYVAPSLAAPAHDAGQAWSPLYAADTIATTRLMQAAVDASGGGAGRQLATTALSAMAPAMIGSNRTRDAAGSVPTLRARLAALVAAGEAGAAPAATRLGAQAPEMVMPAAVADGFAGGRDEDTSGAAFTPATVRAETPRPVEAARGVEPARVAEAVRAVEAARASTPAQPRAEATADRDAVARQVAADARERAAVARAVETERAQHAHRMAEAQRAAGDAQRAIAQRMDEAQRSAVAQRQAQAVAQAQVAQAQVAQAQVAQAQVPQVTPAQIAAPSQSQAPGMPMGLRMVELLARGIEAGQAPSPIAGPRVALPAGLGGLVGASGTAAAIGAMTSGRSIPAGAWLPPPPVAVAGEPPRPRPAIAPTLALPAVTQARPTMLEHVAWADRWLARMAGAQPRALAAYDASTGVGALGSGVTRASTRAGAAPAPVFVSPDAADAPAEAQAQAAPGSGQVVRYDDSDVTPDEVFLAIAAARSRPDRRAPAAAAPATTARATSATARITPADAVLTSVPMAPGAGLSPGLAASPIAPALASILPLAPSASFDVRALFGSEVAAAYLGGLLASSSFAVDQHGGLQSTLASSMTGLGRFAAPAPFTASARAGMAPAMDVVAPTDVESIAPAPRGRDAFTPGVAGELAAQLVHPSLAASQDGDAPELGFDAGPMTLRPALLLPQPQLGAAGHDPAEWSSAVGPFATAAAVAGLPDHYLSATGDDDGADLPTPRSPAAGGATTAPLWSGRPGMTAERSRRWAAHTQQSAADLSLDFVSPELVLAARVYGLSPADAAQATRLATGGPTALQVLAGEVEMTFLRALAGDAELRGEDRSGAHAREPGGAGVVPTTAYPVGDVAGFAPSAFTASSSSAATAPTAASLASSLPAAARRAPRGAFLWPAATVGALGMRAADPDGEGALPIAALELLAASAVAQLGSYAIAHGATAEESAQLVAGRGGLPFAAGLPFATAAGPAGFVAPAGFAGAAMPGSMPMQMPGAVEAPEADAEVMASAAAMSAPQRARFQALYVALTQSAAGREMSPVGRAARALALSARGDEAAAMTSRDRAALAWSVMPVVEGGALSPELAAALGADAGFAGGAAFGGMPGAMPGAPAGAATPWSMRAPELTPLSGSAGSAGVSSGPGYADDTTGSPYGVDTRPGLGGLSGRAGEALSSYVTPLAAPAMAMAPGVATQAAPTMAQRAPTAAPELVRTSGSASRGRYGGGEVEIPSWFEAAARKMLENRGAGDGISLAELTLVTAAPSTHIAASTRGQSAAASSVPSVNTVPAKPGMPDIEKLAQEVYAEFLAMMEGVRLRNNGEP